MKTEQPRMNRARPTTAFVLALAALSLAACGPGGQVPRWLWPFQSAEPPTPPVDPDAPPPTPPGAPPIEPPPEPPPADGTAPGELPPTDPAAPAEPPPSDTPPSDGAPPVDTPPPEPSEPVTPPPEMGGLQPTEPVTPPPTEPPAPPRAGFELHRPGSLLPTSGQGFEDYTNHAPDMLFPVRNAPAYLQSQVYNFGGGVPGGDQCDPRNYAFPWRDNFCETRSREFNTPHCPTQRVHLGVDIRVGTAADCNRLRGQAPAARGLHEVVAVADGVISQVGSYSVHLRSGGRIYRYLHLNMARLSVTRGQEVKAGDLIGYVSNDFGGNATTFHLHFEIQVNVAGQGWVFVPPYVALARAYERQRGLEARLVGTTDALPQPVATASSGGAR